MYFLEQGNVDDDATLIMIFLVSFKDLQSYCLMQSAVCSLQSVVCSLQMSYTVQSLNMFEISSSLWSVPPLLTQI